MGGPGRAVMVEIDPVRMAGVGVTVADLRQALQSANLGLPVGDLISGNRAVAIESGPFLRRQRGGRPGGGRARPASRCSCATWPRCATARRRRPLCVARRRRPRTAPRRPSTRR
jgi:hypothetical protein